MPLDLGPARAAESLVDAVESWNGLHSVLSNLASAQLTDFRSGRLLPVTPTNVIMFSALTGAVGSIGYDATVGRIVQTWASAAAATAMSMPVSVFGFPLYKQFALAGSIPSSLLPPFRRYRLDYLVRRTVVGVSEIACGAGYDANGVITGPSTGPGAVWSTRPAVNGGAWTPRYRLVSAGPVLDGPSSGLTDAAWHQASLVYEEGLIPRLRWLLDERQVFALEGGAAMLSPVAGAFSCVGSKGLGAIVGTTVQYAETRYRCEEVG